MNVDFVAVVAATIVQFAVGAIWYMVIFPKQWGEMFGFDKLSKAKQKEMQAQMGPFYGLQLAVTFLTAYVLVHFISVSSLEYWKVAFLVWLGFVLPTQVSAVIFGGVDPKWIVRRIGIMASGSLATLMAAAYVISLF